MTLLQLRYFQTVCRCESVLQAAEVLHMTQPSISSAIKALETEFHVVLFQRQHRGMKLTEAGEQFLVLADRLLAHADQVEQAMDDISRKSRRIRLGVPPMIGSLILPQLYQGFVKAFPDVQITIEEDGRAGLMRQLASGQLDVAFLPHDKPFDGTFETVHITDLETVCCVSAAHPLANRTRIQIEDLQEHSLVLFKNSFFQTESIKQRFHTCGLSPRVLLYTDQLSTVRRMVTREIAAGFMFSKLSETLPETVSIPLEPPMNVQVSLVWRRSSFTSRDILRFIEYIQENFGSG